MAINVDNSFEVDENGVAIFNDDGDVLFYLTTGDGNPTGSAAPVNTLYVDRLTQLIYYKFGVSDSEWRQLRAEDISFDDSSFPVNASNLQTAVSSLAQNTGLIPETLWAEESAGLANNQREWSFGNGSTGAVNLIAMYAGRITKMFLHAESPGTSVTINVLINNVIADTGTFNANGVFTFTTPIDVAEGDQIGFQTGTVTGAWTDVRVGVALVREIPGLQGPQGPQGDPGTPGPSNHSGLTLDDGTNPHGTTQTDVGLGNVDNTSDLDKPVSTAQQVALDLKYDASNPNGYETPAELNARDTANRARANHTGTQPVSTITGLSSVATSGNHSDLTLEDGTNPHGTTKADVGLGNADNTSDLDKPISTATQAALDLKADNFIEINSVAGETTGGGDLTANRTIGLANVGTAGSSSAADSSLDITVDLKGRVTSFSRTLINIVSNQVSNFETSVRATVLTGLSLVDSAVTAADTVLGAIGKLQGQINGILANFFYAETTLNDAGLVKNTQTFEVYQTLNATVPVTGEYKVTWTYVWSLNDAANDFVGQLRVNGGVVYDHIEEPKDAGGTGVILPNTDGGGADTGTNQRHILTAHEIVNLTAGANTMDVQFRCSTNNDRAAIYRGRISIEKWGIN